MLALKIIFFILVSLISLAGVEFLMIVIDGAVLEDMYETPFWWVKHILALVGTLAIIILLAILIF